MLGDHPSSLKWRKSNGITFSELGKVANRMVCSPPCSVESERLVGISTNIYTPHLNDAGDCGEMDAFELQCQLPTIN